MNAANASGPLYELLQINIEQISRKGNFLPRHVPLNRKQKSDPVRRSFGLATNIGRHGYAHPRASGEFEGHIPYLRCLGPGFRLRRKRPVSASARFREFEGHIPYLRCLGPGFRLRRKRPVSVSARFTNDSPPNGRPVRVWSRSSSIPSGWEERNAFQSSISASGPRLCTRGSFSMSPIAHRALDHW